MTAKEIESLEKKYKEFLPTPSAKQILKLINYVRELEKKLNASKPQL